MTKFQRKILVTLEIDEKYAAAADETTRFVADDFRKLYEFSDTITVKSATVIPNYKRDRGE